MRSASGGGYVRGVRKTPFDAVRAACSILLLLAAACSTESGGGDAGSDAASPEGPESGLVSEASSAVDGAQLDAPVDAGALLDATIVDATPDVAAADVAAADVAAPDDASGGDGSILVDHAICHAEWPQPETYPGGGGTFDLAVDPQGDAYIAIAYAGTLSVDLGVANPGYPVGIAIAKVDPQCQLVWMREFGEPQDGGATSMNGNIAVDATSSITFTGWFVGTADLGAGATSSAGDLPEGFVMRLDTDGNVVFRNLYTLIEPHVLSVDGTGTATILSTAIDPISATVQYAFVQIDASGNQVASQTYTSSDGYAPAVVAAYGGTLWTSHAGSLAALTTSGSTLWSVPFPDSGVSSFAAGPQGLVGVGATASGEVVQAFGDGGAIVSTTVNGLPPDAPEAAQVAVGSTGTIYVGGTLPDPTQPPADAECCVDHVGAQVLGSGGQLQTLRIWQQGDFAMFGALAVDPSGNAFLGGPLGSFDGGFGYYLVKLGP
jgi:hypothetical protein